MNKSQSQKNQQQQEDQNSGLKENDKISVKDLLYGLLLRSGNDSAVALAEHIAGSTENFVEIMNKKAKELELKTHTLSRHTD